MKKLLFFASIIVAIFLLTGCGINLIQGNYVGSLDQGNYVWGGAMNLAWNELNDNILHGKLQLNTTDQTALAMVNKFNNPVFTKNDLDEASYYIKSGYGQETVTAINQESKAKFPDKSFPDLQLKLSPHDIITYAYFLKEVHYLIPFSKKDVLFNGQKVAGFYAASGEQKGNLIIIDYTDYYKFIISLRLKDDSDQLFLAKGYDMNDLPAIVKDINDKKNGSYFNSMTVDGFEAPMLNLDYQRSYSELIGKSLANQNFENYIITDMLEKIKFKMDETGATVENEARMGLLLGPSYKFILDKPYWVIMMRKNSQNPYFILGVNNTELMEKK
jgi:hypothetical protein